MAYEVLSKDELMHHGILGMKWGVRRYQNQDGSWTAAGRERYGKAKGRYEAARENYKALSKSTTATTKEKERNLQYRTGRTKRRI